MTKFLVGLEKFLHSLTHSFCRYIVKALTFPYLFLKRQKVLPFTGEIRQKISLTTGHNYISMRQISRFEEIDDSSNLLLLMFKKVRQL